MNGANICESAEKVWVDFPPDKGWIKLLDLDNIICRKSGRLIPISVEECCYCENMSWENTNQIKIWEHSQFMNVESYQDNFDEDDPAGSFQSDFLCDGDCDSCDSCDFG